jgi:hypothetical protein
VFESAAPYRQFSGEGAGTWVEKDEDAPDAIVDKLDGAARLLNIWKVFLRLTRATLTGSGQCARTGGLWAAGGSGNWATPRTLRDDRV